MKKYLIVFIFLFQLLWIFAADDNKNLEFQLYGMNIFANQNFDTLPAQTAAGKDYVLSSGDIISIVLISDMLTDITKDGMQEIKIPPSGSIAIPGFGIFNLRGKSIDEAEKMIRDSAVKKIRDVKIDISLVKMRSVNIFVFGEVEKPGPYSLAPNSSVIAALYKAGGITKNSSLRKVKLLRDGKTKDIDLYDFLLSGEAKSNLGLNDGDTIFVPSTNNFATIYGQVAREGIYEINDTTSLEKLIEFAGGASAGAYTIQVQVKRVGNDKKEIVSTSDLAGFKLKAGDIIEIGKNDERYKNGVMFLGNVNRPGIYEIKQGEKFSEIIKKAGGLKKESYTDKVQIIRVKADTTLEKYSFNMNNEDPELKPEDEITVFSLQDASSTKKVRITGPVNAPGTYPIYENSRVSDLIFAAKGIIADKAHFGRADLYRLGENGDIQLIKIELSKVLQGDKKADITLEDYDYLKVYLEEDASLSSDVYIYGEVRKAGTYNFMNNMTISDLIFFGKGLKISADKNSVEVVRSSLLGEGIDVIIVDLEKEPNFKLSEYDQVFVRKIPNWEDKKIIELNGYVRYPGKYAISDKESLNSVIKRAGGFSEKAFPAGIKFYRKKNFRDELAGMNIKFEEEMLSKDKVKLSNLSYNEKTKMYNENLLLKDGDVIEIPEEASHVTIMGEVYIPGIVVYEPGKKMAFYVNASGGYTDKAYENKTFVIKYNGKTEKNGWFKKVKIEPGDTIMVPADNRQKGAWDRFLGILDGVAKIGTVVLLIKNVTN